MFISKVLADGYMARRSQRSAKLIWSKVPLAPAGLDIRIDERDVPEEIREQAYNMFEADRERDAESLRIRFGLTPAEVRLVLRLITGQSLRSSAESIGDCLRDGALPTQVGISQERDTTTNRACSRRAQWRRTRRC